MSVQIVIELQEPIGAQAVIQALESYKVRLRASIQRTRSHLDKFERKYDISTERFFVEMTAEDMDGGDLEYVEWAGEAKLLSGLEAELNELEHARYQLP